ncbi:methyltransferase family protein [Marinomonas flavescens]|uniref:methyltransferase family protein n=1 Tax=Marinomonas flavescens TaxID=2529379 RepID=UPI00105647E6|nr:isoprenylcysteine carboxylmethyltransferase family protein [Marinomonas flavescens]
MLALKIPPPVIFAVTAVSMFALSGFHFQIDLWLFVLSGFVWFVALGVAVSAILSFTQSKTTVNPHQPDKSTALVVTGVFHYSRNPMYLSLAMILLGWAILLNTFWVFLPIVFFVLYLTYFQIKPEEAILAGKFGEDYQGYCCRVRRWI